jgi:hypothetical protein
MACILTIGKIGPRERLDAMLASAGHRFASLECLDEAREFGGWNRFDIVLLGEKLTYGERELIAELIRASGASPKLIFLYEFFIGNPQSADAIVDIALGFEYLPDAIHYVMHPHGSIRRPATTAKKILPPNALRA